MIYTSFFKYINPTIIHLFNNESLTVLLLITTINFADDYISNKLCNITITLHLKAIIVEILVV